ncbi:hypothetical protein MRY87_13190 [bacterium]|nr:hypothetical protein [bacterium]
MILSVKRAGMVSGVGVQPMSGASGKSFQEVMRSLDSPAAGATQPTGAPPVRVPEDPFLAMQDLARRVVGGENLSSHELLVYQVRAGEFGMNVELVSKVAESVGASLRKLQNQG